MKKFFITFLAIAFVISSISLAACDKKTTTTKEEQTTTEEKVTKKDLEVSIANLADGKVTATYDGQVKSIFAMAEGNVTLKIEYEGKGNTSYTKSTTAPTNAGEYSVSVTYAGDSTYNSFSSTLVLVISKGMPTVTVEMENYSESDTPKTPTVTTNSTGTVTFTYEGVEDTTYEASATAPTQEGTYKVTAKVAETENFLEATGSANFTIEAQKAQAPTTAPVQADGDSLTYEMLAVKEETGKEFRLLLGESVIADWQTSGTFYGLKPDTEYVVQVRTAGTAELSPSEPSELVLKLKTSAGALVDTFERKALDAGGHGNFVMTDEHVHSGERALKTDRPDGAYGYILWPQSMLERYADESGEAYWGYYQNGSFENNYVNFLPYRYMSMWVYVEEDCILKSGLEVWKQTYGDVFVTGAGTELKGGEWTKVVFDFQTTSLLRGSLPDILSHVEKLYFNFNPDEAKTFYFDDVYLYGTLDKQETTITVENLVDDVLTYNYDGEPVTMNVTVTGGFELTYSYVGIGETTYETSSTAPTEVGTYKVTVSFAGNDLFNAATKEFTLNIVEYTAPVVEPPEDDALNTFEGFTAGTALQGFEVSKDRAHTGVNSLKAATPDGAGAAFIINLESLVGYNSETHTLDISECDTLEFYFYTTYGSFVINNGFEIWAGSDVYNCGVGQTVAANEWVKVTIDLKTNPIIRGDWATISANVDKIMLNLNPWLATDIFGGAVGPFYIDDLKFYKKVEIVEPPLDPSLNTFEDFETGRALQGFEVSEDMAHTGTKSLKSRETDGANATFIINLETLKGYNSETHKLDISNYDTLEFYLYTTYGSFVINSGFEIWAGENVYNCGVGQAVAANEWVKVTIDLKTNPVIRGDWATISANIDKIMFNLYPWQATDVIGGVVGAFYIDDIRFYKSA